MTVYFYALSCESCHGNQVLAKVEQLCKKNGLDFQERRTVLWTKWEEEAKQIIKLNKGLKLPFFYRDDTGAVMGGYSGTPLMEIEKFLR